MADAKPIIGVMTDLYTGMEGTVFTAGKTVKIEGSRLKITGEEGGIYFAPAAENNEPVTDENQWIKAEKMIRNSSKYLEFFMPPALSADTSYCIVIKTNNLKGSSTKKKYETAVSEAVTIIEE